MAMIETEHLKLIQPSMKYVEDLFQLHTNDEATRYTPLGRHKDIEDTANYIQQWQQHWQDNQFGYFLIQPKDKDVVVGIMGYEYRTINDQHFLNLYYRLLPEFTGHNYAFEAISRIDEWMLSRDNETTQIVRTNIQNVPSIKLAQRLGFNRDKEWDDVINKSDICLFKS